MYHAFEAKLEQWSRTGCRARWYYTHSKLIDTASSVFDARFFTDRLRTFRWRIVSICGGS